MDLLDLLGSTAFYVFRALIVVLPLLVWSWVIGLSRTARGGHGSGDATALAGAMFGLAALPLLIPPVALNFDAVIAPDGVWDLTVAEFFERAARYQLRAMLDVAFAMAFDDDRVNLFTWCGLALAIWTLRIGAAIGQRRGRRTGQLLTAELIVFAVSLQAVVYLGTLLLWSVNQLNFWMAVVAIFLIQDYRHNEPPLLPRIIHALSGWARRDSPQPEGVMVVD
jgi:hypothetical protein